MHKSPPHDLWLEPVLERHLAATFAPDNLWDRVQHPRPVRSTATPRWTPLLIFAAATLAATAVFIPFRAGEASTARQLAVTALSRAPEDLEFRSDAATEIRAWVKLRTGVDIPLPSRTSPEIRLAGVCAAKGGVPAIEVAYRVGGRNAALLVSKTNAASPGDGRHRFLKCESVGATRVSSWTMRGRLYTLAYAAPAGVMAGDSRDECLLCHAIAQSPTLSN